MFREILDLKLRSPQKVYTCRRKSLRTMEQVRIKLVARWSSRCPQSYKVAKCAPRLCPSTSSSTQRSYPIQSMASATTPVDPTRSSLSSRTTPPKVFEAQTWLARTVETRSSAKLTRARTTGMHPHLNLIKATTYSIWTRAARSA
jgi:hypothetical protein